MSDVSPLEHSMLATFVLPVAQTLRMQGIDALEVLEGMGIDMAKAANPDWRVSHETFQGLLGRCVELTGDEAFGLVAAEQLQPQVLHGLGLAWLASDTVYDGLVRMVRFGKLISTSAELRLEEQDDLVHVYLGRNMEMDNFVSAARDYGVGMITRMCRLTVGEFLAPVLIQIERPVPRATRSAGNICYPAAWNSIAKPLALPGPAPTSWSH